MQPEAPRPSILYTLSVVLAGGAVGAFSAVAFGLQTKGMVEDELAARPRIAVVDYGRVADMIGPGTQPEHIEVIAAQMRSDVTRLVTAGFLVLDAGAVQGGPPELVMPVPIPPRPKPLGGAAGAVVGAGAGQAPGGVGRTPPPVLGPGTSLASPQVR